MYQNLQTKKNLQNVKYPPVKSKSSQMSQIYRNRNKLTSNQMTKQLLVMQWMR